MTSYINLSLLTLFLVIGMIALWIGIGEIIKSITAGKWPMVYATIRSVELKEDDSTYAVKVIYSYKIGGVEYQGDTLSFGYSASSGIEAHKQIYEKLEKAEIIEARYNPKNHSESCLTYGISRSHLLGITLTISWLLLTIALYGAIIQHKLYEIVWLLVFPAFLFSFVSFLLNDTMLLKKLNVVRTFTRDIRLERRVRN